MPRLLLMVVAYFNAFDTLHAAPLTEKGGIYYYTQQGPLCPGLRILHPQPGRFEIRPNPPRDCSLEFPPSQGLFTFVLGALPPGTIHIATQDELGLTSSLTFQIPETTSQPMTAIKQDAAGRLTFHINGLDFIQYTVERSSDFKTWIDVATLSGESDFTETEPLDTPVFYRLRIPSDHSRRLQ